MPLSSTLVQRAASLPKNQVKDKGLLPDHNDLPPINDDELDDFLLKDQDERPRHLKIANDANSL